MMIKKLSITLLLANIGFISACSTTIPEKVAPYQQEALPVPEKFPTVASYDDATEVEAILKNWQKVYSDTRLQEVTKLALENNRDLRNAVLNIDLARTQYDLQRTNLYPTVNGAFGGSHGETGQVNYATGRSVGVTTSYNANLNATWQADLFGRIKSLNEAALQQYFAARQNRDAARISLMASVAAAWLNLSADQEQLKLSEMTLKSREQTLGIVQKRFDIGVTDKLVLRQTQILAETARNDVANLKTAVQQDINVLRMLVGTDIDASLLPKSFSESAIIGNLPVGLPSQILLNRPDIVAAEHNLKAMDANITVARAAFFPQVSLTGNIGRASTDLGKLISGGTNVWSFAPSVTVPIFNHGANEANFEAAKIRRDMAVNTYESTIQSAFRDVADQLAIRANIGDRFDAQNATLNAATESRKIVQARYDRGIDSLLTLIDSQRVLYGAQQQLISIKLSKALNMVNLYSALGGGLDTNNIPETIDQK